ncbi:MULTISPECIES: hypothetical protein [unclassified Megasphaera]|uniref:hypothetical protein n=1 Tax=unclassified Megasphaera TaxID=2626256 RepID=UPI00178C29E1|nr:hypothetical protein [Megasphaera sp. BL7]
MSRGSWLVGAAQRAARLNPMSNAIRNSPAASDSDAAARRDRLKMRTTLRDTLSA